jgi:methyltransferase
MVTVYFVVIALVVGERIVELVVSERHARAMFREGALEHGRDHYPFMVALHIALLVGCLVEPIALDRPFIPALGVPMLVVAILAQALRWWAIRTLGTRWSTRVIVPFFGERVVRGPYRFFPHPNYVAVIAEGIALPLIHTAWITALVFTVLNAFLLLIRIRVEDRAMDVEEARASRPIWSSPEAGRPASRRRSRRGSPE